MSIDFFGHLSLPYGYVAYRLTLGISMARLDWFIRANLRLKHLQLLVALDDLRNVGKVAAHLHVTQPAISKALAALEAGLGVRLFDRTARGMEPTEHGVCLIRYARGILSQLAEARDELRNISEGRITRVAVGVMPSAAMVLVPQFITRLEAKATSVSIEIREGATDSLLPALRLGEIDFIVGLLPLRPLGLEFTSEVLYEDPVVVAVRSGHPLTRAGQLTWEMLGDYPMVLPPGSTHMRSSIDVVFARHQVTMDRSYVETISAMTTIGVLQATDSIGFLARQLAVRYETLGVLSVLKLSLTGAQLRIGLIWKAERHMTGVQEHLRQLFRSTCQELLRI